MKINVSGPNGLNYMTLMDMAQAILNDPKTMISDIQVLSVHHERPDQH